MDYLIELFGKKSLLQSQTTIETKNFDCVVKVQNFLFDKKYV